MKLILIITSLFFFCMPSIAQTEDFRDALRLYEKGIYGRSKMFLDEIGRESGKADPIGYSLLCDI